MTCVTCNDTHVMALGDSTVPCTWCPTPCESCRDGQAPYCATTPCPCQCHAPTPAKIREDIELSRRASTGMPSDLAAPHVALADLCLAYLSAVDAADRCELTEEALTAAGEQVEVAERQLRAALGLGLSEPDAQLASALREVGSEHTPPAGWQQRVLLEVARDNTVTTEHVARKHWDADTSARGESSDYIEGWNDAVDAFERRSAAVEQNRVTLTFDRLHLDTQLACIERNMIRAGRIADAHRCAIARDHAHPHSAGEAAALLLGLPSPYPDRAEGDRSLTIGGTK